MATGTSVIRRNKLINAPMLIAINIDHSIQSITIASYYLKSDLRKKSISR